MRPDYRFYDTFDVVHQNVIREAKGQITSSKGYISNHKLQWFNGHQFEIQGKQKEDKNKYKDPHPANCE